MSYDYTQARSACLNTVIADGKPHKKVKLKSDEVDITPMMLVYPSTAASGLFDQAPDNYGGADGEGFVYLVEIPHDYPGRDNFDKTTAFADLAEYEGYRCQKNREYHVISGDLTGEYEGLILKCGAAGIVDEPAVAANTTPDTIGHGFVLIKGVSTTESIVEYIGLIHYDDSA